MGLLDIFSKEKRKMRIIGDQFKLISNFTPSFTSYYGGVYEMDLTRSSIHTLATHTSKLNPVIIGNAYKQLENILQNKPNSIMTTQQFLYRLRTIYEVENNAYIIPIYADNTAMQIVGLYPISTIGSELVVSNNKLYLKYSIGTQIKAIEYERVGHLRKHYYRNEYFGDSNSALNTTMELLNIQNEGIINGVKQSASIRFLAQIATVLKPEDVTAERNRLMSENLSVENNGGILLYDSKYKDIKPIDSKPWVIDDKQATIIKNNVFNYFNTNEKILQNNFTEDEWNAFYEGAVEPFAIQLSQVITSMLFTDREISFNNKVIFESARLQYASNTTKLNIVTQLFDRGFMTHNQGLEIFNLPPIENGDELYLRLEYANVQDIGGAGVGEENQTTTGEQNVEENDNNSSTTLSE